MKQKRNVHSRTRRSPRSPLLSVIIPVRNEEKNIKRVIENCKRISARTEILVIANGCTDRSESLAKRMGARVISFAEALGHDVGRAIGAYHAQGKILLFLDADMIVSAAQLQPFIRKINSGYDIALNQYPKMHRRYPPHPTITAKQTLNIILNRSDLRAASLTTIPFAMTKRAARKIGYANLAIPPLAQAIAIELGLRIGVGGFVNVGRLNPVRKYPLTDNRMNPITELIVGDHLEAIAYVIEKRGFRGGFSDLSRMRDKLLSVKEENQKSFFETQWNKILERNDTEQSTSDMVTIIPACNESSTIGTAIRTIKESGLEHVFVIDNGSTDNTARQAKQVGADVYQYSERLGHDIGRAVGAIVYEDVPLLFMDGDMTVPSKDFVPFVRSIGEGTDVALNNLTQLLPPNQQFDKVSIIKRFLNLVMKRPDLGICSLTAVPHALSSYAVQEIGALNLAVPPLAHVIALHKNLQVKAVHSVDVVKRNKVRPNLHLSTRRPLERLIIGDHIEAIAYIQKMVSYRGYFPDTIRKRDLLDTYLEKASQS